MRIAQADPYVNTFLKFYSLFSFYLLIFIHYYAVMQAIMNKKNRERGKTLSLWSVYLFYPFLPQSEQKAKAIRSAATTLAPLGVSKA